MAKDKELIEKLHKWTEQYSEEADAVHVNVSTNEQFTIRDLMNQLEGKKGKPRISAEETEKLKGEVGKWLDEWIREGGN